MSVPPGCQGPQLPAPGNATSKKVFDMFTAWELEAGVSVCVPMEVSAGWEDPGNLLCPARDLSQDHHTYPRDHSPIPGIIPQSQGLFLHQGLFPHPREQGPHRTKQQGQQEEGQTWKANAVGGGDGNVAKQLLPASDSSVPRHLCQITRINTGWSPSRGAGNR